ncbi:hypothetical protein KKG48_04165 [Patescibacteria group bacterium]|nr:hypothetical protein [Patescibacteria group bacterium]
MKIKKYFLGLAVLSILSGALIVFASVSDIQYPVKELGNCESKTACGVYCDNSANMGACLDFAEEHNLMSAEEIAKARKFKNLGAGPGDCATKDSCEIYCDSIEHMDECVAFAEKNGLMSAKELEEAKKIQVARDRGVKMLACGGKKQCDAFCSEASHMEECITFGQEVGLMSEEELADSKKVLAAIKAGATPPPCGGKEECDLYCSEESHFDACLDFALAAGFMDPKDAEMARKTGGKGPGGCRGKEECDAFCEQEGNMEICGQFAYDNGMVTKEEFEMMKKTKGKGPGGCKSIEECDNFCNNPDNQETCFNFAKENGMMSDDDVRQMEDGKQQFQQSMQDIPSEVYSCLESLIGVDMTAKFKNGEAMPPKEIGDQMQKCFGENMPQMPENMQPGDEEHGFAPGTTGPGGCASEEECKKYCETNPEKCNNLQPPCEGDGCQQSPQEYAPGTGPDMEPMKPMDGGMMQMLPCEGDECQQLPQEYAPGIGPDSMMNKPPCEGEECQQSLQEFSPGTGPDMEPMKPMDGGMMQMLPCEGDECQQLPQEYVPPAELMEQQPVSTLDLLLGAILAPFIQIFQ